MFQTQPLSGIAVVKEGHGDMAVSNAIGSNVFDILVCLDIRLFIQTAIKVLGSEVLVQHEGEGVISVIIQPLNYSRLRLTCRRFQASSTPP